MKKLKLQLEDLMIDSFATTPPKKASGTVFGEQCTCYTACTCPGCPTCDASCNGTCGATCAGTCNASCNGSCDYSCDYSCDGCSGAPGCASFVTSPGPMQVCQDCMA